MSKKGTIIGNNQAYFYRMHERKEPTFGQSSQKKGEEDLDDSQDDEEMSHVNFNAGVNIIPDNSRTLEENKRKSQELGRLNLNRRYRGSLVPSIKS